MCVCVCWLWKCNLWLGLLSMLGVCVYLLAKSQYFYVEYLLENKYINGCLIFPFIILGWVVNKIHLKSLSRLKNAKSLLKIIKFESDTKIFVATVNDSIFECYFVYFIFISIHLLHIFRLKTQNRSSSTVCT